ncbi:MAG: SIR2 family protein [Methylococcaceae bacterium]|nr:SIR2 family protein [Methylococcaceae bacterium]
MSATLTPQEAVNCGLAKPSECDVVIVILWSRMGTPLPDTYLKVDGSRYLSGTEYEYEEAITSKSPPHTLVYWRKTKLELDPDNPDADEKLQQRRRVNEFFARFRNPDGSLKGGYAEYETPQTFRDRLRLDLRAFIEQLLAQQTPEPSAQRAKVPPPYGFICKALTQGRVVPFIGAGASSSGRPPNVAWDPAAPIFLPSGIELSHLLADEIAFPSSNRDDLAEVSSYYETFYTRATLRERLRQILCTNLLSNVQISPLYRFLAEIPAPLLIVTTNYDTEIEQAFRAANRAYDLVVYPADRKDLANAILWWPHGTVEPETQAPNDLDIDLTKTSVIFKMYGSFSTSEDWDSFVITEEDHVDFLSHLSSKSAIPSLFSAHFHDRSLLFIGYSLRDWALRVVFRGLSRYFARPAIVDEEEEIQCWAIEDELTELEEKLWSKRAVHPYEVGIDAFVEKLRAKMEPR